MSSPSAFSAVFLAISLAGAAAGAAEDAFPGADALIIRDFTGAIEIRGGQGPIRAEIEAGRKAYPVEMRVIDGALVIAGEERPRHFQLHKELDYRTYKDEALIKYLEDYPRLVVTAPNGVDIEFDDAITIANVRADAGLARVRGGHVDAVFADARKADISIDGAGDISMSRIAGAADIAINGSGDFMALEAGEASLAINGSGDIDMGPIGGRAELSVQGSGDIRVASVGDAADISVQGSGDIETGPVAKGADLSIAGSGDIKVARINGPARVSIAGAGDIGVADGRAENLKVSIAGSGDFVFGGVSTNLDASIIGSGAISVSANEGDLRYTERDGDLFIGGERIKTRK